MPARTEAMKDFSLRFLSHLKFWAFHCSLTATPSFLLAGIHLQLFQKVPATLGMLTGIGFFILGYTLLNTLVRALEQKEGPFFRATHLALKIRLLVSLVSIPVVLFITNESPAILFLPDYWAGWAAAILISLFEGLFALEDGSYLHTLLWTVTEGFILSFTLFMGTFFCLLIIGAIDRKRFLKKAASPQRRIQES